MCFTQQGSFSSAVRRSCGGPAPLQEQPTEEKSTMTPADVCDAIKFCGAMANAIAWARLALLSRPSHSRMASPCRLRWSYMCTGSEADGRRADEGGLDKLRRTGAV